MKQNALFQIEFVRGRYEMNEKSFENFTLLIDGKNAFPMILQSIENAKKSLLINMFIWRDDTIGNRIGEAVLAAAERGVQVQISVDRYGVVLEKAEENRKSFFHKRQSLAEKVKIAALRLFYPMKGTQKRAKDEETELYKKILSHPNVTVEKDIFKADHSKYYVVDNRILFVGGINIEDKENGADMQGRVYQDYMVKIEGEEAVQAFLSQNEGGMVATNGYFFGCNRKSVRRFDMEKHYLAMIEGAEKELCIVMAYFSPLKAFMNAIIRAHKRGVRVFVMIPSFANFQNDTNRKTLKTLMKRTNGGIQGYLSPKMVHTKMIYTEKWASFGSTNITKKAFEQLDELNLFFERAGSALEKELLNSVEENIALAQRVTNYKKIKYDRVKAFFEGFLV